MSLSQLRSFCEVYRAGSYSEAARRLHLTTSAVWEQIRGLERHYDATLLEGRAGAIAATAEGRRLAELVMPLLAGLESAREVLLQERGRPPGSVTLVSGMRMLMEEVGQAIARFRQLYPGVRLRLLYADDHEIEPMIERGEADLGLILEPGPGRVRRPAVSYEPAYELGYLLVTPAGHPLLSGRGLRLRDVVRYPLILGVPGTASRRHIDEVLHLHDLLDQVSVAVETNSAALTFAAVRAGAAVGITAGNPSGLLCQGLGVRPLGRWFGAARYVFLWTKGAYVGSVQRTLADLILERIADAHHVERKR